MGLCDSSRRNWYPVDPQDLMRGAARLESTPEEIHQMLERNRIFASDGEPERMTTRESITDAR